MLFGLVSRVLRLASIVICAIAVLWFVSFALDQSKAASAHQQAEVNSESTSNGGAEKQSSLHKAIDKAFSTLSSPFSGVVSSSSGAWTIHIVETLLVLLVYGFGLAFVARLLRLNP